MRRHLGEFEQVLLLALAHLGEDAYGVSIATLIAARTGRVLSPGAIYTALDRLERRGFVSSRWGDPTPERGGKRKRYYRLRSPGASALRQAQNTLARMARGLRTKAEPR
jgi:PadR family transcriptional regulator, regulatory protein PadR